jgi:hypothetical protein
MACGRGSEAFRLSCSDLTLHLVALSLLFAGFSFDRLCHGEHEI